MKGLEVGHVMRVVSLNIRSGQAGGLEAVLQALRQGKFGVGILQETNLIDRIHMCYGSGYLVWETEVDSRHWGGGWKQEAVWQVEGVENYGPDVVSFLLMLGVCRCYVVGAYVPPNYIATVHQVEQVLVANPNGV